MAEKRKGRPKASRLPSYCLHRGSGQAYVKIRGKVTYLGVHGSDASRLAYSVVVNDVLDGREVTPPKLDTGPASRQMTVNEVCGNYVAHAQAYYVKGGKPTSEVGIVSAACEYASELYWDQLAESFGPLALEAVRDRMIEAGLARTTINGLISRIRRAFKWAAGKERIPAGVSSALSTVSGLRLQKKRWIVERTFGWLNRSRRLAKSFERTTESDTAFVQVAMIQLMVKRLA